MQSSNRISPIHASCFATVCFFKRVQAPAPLPQKVRKEARGPRGIARKRREHAYCALGSGVRAPAPPSAAGSRGCPPGQLSACSAPPLWRINAQRALPIHHASTITSPALRARGEAPSGGPGLSCPPFAPAFSISRRRRRNSIRGTAAVYIREHMSWCYRAPLERRFRPLFRARDGPEGRARRGRFYHGGHFFTPGQIAVSPRIWPKECPGAVYYASE